MAYNKDYIVATELTGAARAAADALTASLPLSQFLPAKENATLDYQFNASDTPFVDVAEYSTFDTVSQYGRTGPTITKQGSLPPIRRKLSVSELSRLLLGGNSSAVVATLEGYAEKLGVSIAARLELARVEVVLTGKLSLAEDNVAADIDFGRDASLTVPALTGTNQWTNAANAKPIDNLIAWRELVKVASRGGLPSTVVLSTAILNALATNAQVINLSLSRSTDLPGRISADAVKAVLAGYAGLTRVIVADEAYSAFDFGKTVWPSNQVALLPGGGLSVAGVGALGSTDFGIPAEALKSEYALAEGERAGIFAGAFDSDDPEGLSVLASAIALPILQRPNATLAATVAA
jgi:hypothetical protein